MNESFCDLLRRAEQLFLQDGYAVRFRLNPARRTSPDNLIPMHYGKSFALFDDKIVVKATQDIQNQLAQLLANSNRQSIIAEKLAHLQPGAAKPGQWHVSKFLMEFLRNHSSQPEAVLAKIIAHKSRKWSQSDLSDIIGANVKMDATITIKSSKAGCNASLGHNITINDRSITIRKLNLPETVLVNMKENGSKMTVKQIVDHPYLPDFAISTIDCNESKRGMTIVIWQTDDYLEMVNLKQSFKA